MVREWREFHRRPTMTDLRGPTVFLGLAADPVAWDADEIEIVVPEAVWIPKSSGGLTRYDGP